MRQLREQARVVGRADGTYQVVCGAAVLASGFDTNAEAWAWIDARDQEHLDQVATTLRIRSSATFA